MTSYYEPEATDCRCLKFLRAVIRGITVWKVPDEELKKCRCPACNGAMKRHGYRERTLLPAGDTEQDVSRHKITRLQCKHCGRCITIYPPTILRFKRYAARVIKSVISFVRRHRRHSARLVVSVCPEIAFPIENRACRHWWRDERLYRALAPISI